MLYKILHIDDDGFYPYYIGRLLEKDDQNEYKLDHVYNIHGLDDITEEYDLVISDLMLDSNDWMKTPRIVLDKYKKTPVMFLTSLLSNYYKKKLSALEYVTYHVKEDIRSDFYKDVVAAINTS